MNRDAGWQGGQKSLPQGGPVFRGCLVKGSLGKREIHPMEMKGRGGRESFLKRLGV